jgi:hypothetical protein
MLQCSVDTAWWVFARSSGPAGQMTVTIEKWKNGEAKRKPVAPVLHLSAAAPVTDIMATAQQHDAPMQRSQAAVDPQGR